MSPWILPGLLALTITLAVCTWLSLKSDLGRNNPVFSPLTLILLHLLSGPRLEASTMSTETPRAYLGFFQSPIFGDQPSAASARSFF